MQGVGQTVTLHPVVQELTAVLQKKTDAYLFGDDEMKAFVQRIHHHPDAEEISVGLIALVMEIGKGRTDGLFMQLLALAACGLSAQTMQDTLTARGWTAERAAHAVADARKSQQKVTDGLKPPGSTLGVGLRGKKG